jgi:hypothetical protein
MVCTSTSRKIQGLRIRVNGEDASPPGSGDHHSRKPDTAAPKDGDGFTRLHASDVNDGSIRRSKPASQTRGHCKGDVCR